MFTLESIHLIPLVLSLIFTFFMLITFWGYSKNRTSFLLLLPLFPFSLCAISIVIPFNIVQIAIYPFYLIGFVLGLRKVYLYKWRELITKCRLYFNQCEKWEKCVLVFILIHLLSTLMGSSILGGLGAVQDATAYHMGSPKEWVMFMNGPHLNYNNPEVMTASYFEYIQYSVLLMFKPLFEYLVPLEKTHYEFLAYTLLVAAQFLTAIFGTILVPLLTFKILKKKKELAYAVVILIFGMKGMTWIWKLAKNDAFPLFCSLVSYTYILDSLKKQGLENIRKVTFLSFLILGIGIGAKMTNVYPMLAILLFMFVKNYKVWVNVLGSNKKLFELIVIAALAGIVGLLPFMIRNYIEAGNPFFPTSSGLFPNEILSDRSDRVHKLYSYPTTWDNSFHKLWMFFKTNPGMILVLSLSLYLRKWKEALFFIIVMGTISKITGHMSTWRQISIIFFFIIIWCEEIYTSLMKLTLNKKVHYAIFGLVILLSQFKPERLVKYPARWYFTSLHKIMPGQTVDWEHNLKENLKYRNKKNHHSFKHTYFSRFFHVSRIDSREELRTIK